jgi:hypothetical protein
MLANVGAVSIPGKDMRLHLKIIVGIAMAVTAVMAAAGYAVAASWQTQEYRTDGFAVDFSGPVAVEKNQEDEKVVRSNIYQQISTSFDSNHTTSFYSTYTIVTTLFASDIQLNFDLAVTTSMGVFKCMVTTSDTTPTFAVDRAREIHSAQCNGGARVAGVFLLKGQWFYQMVYWITDDAELPDAEHFLHSFKLISHGIGGERP